MADGRSTERYRGFYATLLRLALITSLVLAVPLVAMQFSDEVAWSGLDFVVAGGLLFGTGLTFQLVAGRSGSASYRLAAGLACATALFLVWINLAVGLIGSENNPANLLYLGVLIVGTVGAAAARLRAPGMARALFATAFAQALVPGLAIIVWNPLVADEEGLTGLSRVFFLSTVFSLLFVWAGILFRHACTTTDPKLS